MRPFIREAAEVEQTAGAPISSDGLSLGYRIGWRLRKAVMSIWGPAQLGDEDPLARLEAERARKVAEAKAKNGA